MKEVIEKNIGVVWNKIWMTIDIVLDPLIPFALRIIAHKFLLSRKLNSVSCMIMDMGYKIVKKDHSYDLTEL